MRSYRPMIAAVLALMVPATGVPAMTDATTLSQADRDEITGLIAAQDSAWNHGNADGFAARVLPDVVFTNIVGMFSVGKAPFVAQHARIFSTIYKGSSLHQTFEHIALLKADVAIIDTLTVLTGAQHVPPGIEPIDGAVRTRLEQVLVHRADGWWVASFHNVAIHPAAAAGPPAKP